VKDFMSNWNENYYRAKTYYENGIKVKRFHVTKGDHFIFNSINEKLMNNVSVTIHSMSECSLSCFSDSSYNAFNFITK